MNPDGTADSASEPNLEAALALASATGSLETAIGTALSRVGLSFTDLRRLRIIGAQPQGLTREDLAEAMGRLGRRPSAPAALSSSSAGSPAQSPESSSSPTADATSSIRPRASPRRRPPVGSQTRAQPE